MTGPVLLLLVLAAPAAGSTRPSGGPPGPTQTMRIDILGAVAYVTVNRTVVCAGPAPGPAAVTTPAGRAGNGAGNGEGNDTIVDLGLPDRSALLDVDVTVGGRREKTKPMSALKARDAYVESLRGMGRQAAAVAFDDEAQFRIRIACPSNLLSNANKTATIRYSFSTLLEVSNDRARLVFPAAPELTPPPTRVDVSGIFSRGGGAGDISIGGVSHPARRGTAFAAVETVTTRTRWAVSFGPLMATADHNPDHLTALSSVAATRASARPVIAYAVGVAPGPRQVLPERVLFLMDRSRSVGPGGLDAERDIARRILEAMPPSTRFDALFFDRGQKRLFPITRTATREAIAALEDETVPNRMANGTDLASALRAAGDLLRRETSDFSPGTLLIILTDGAIGRPTSENLAGLIGPLPGIQLLTAAISVRPNDDPDVSSEERRVLRGLVAAAPLGGVERSFRTGEIGDAVPAMLEALRRGGDVYSVTFGSRTHSTGLPAPGLAATGTSAVVAEVIGPGSGVAGITSTPLPATLTWRHRGDNQTTPLRPIKVDDRGLTALQGSDTRETRLSIGPAVAVLVEPVVRPPAAPDAGTSGPRGYMERSVVRDALSLAFTPRARACYLNRSARTPQERDLSGRVRLALDLIRGEVGAVRVESSTLGHPIIETCLREAAYALDVPRAYRNDDPVTAVLNLVFRPRTPDRRTATSDGPGFSNELDLMIDEALKESAATTVPQPSGTDAAVPSDR